MKTEHNKFMANFVSICESCMPHYDNPVCCCKPCLLEEAKKIDVKRKTLVGHQQDWRGVRENISPKVNCIVRRGKME